MKAGMMQWHNTFNYEWLTGSIRRDLTPAGRGVWADVLATAGLSRRQGYLERGHGVPYTVEELATWWCTPIEIVKQTFKACIKEGRLKLLDDGTYYVTNFVKYQSKRSDNGNIPLDSSHKEMQGKVIAYKMARKYPKDAAQGVKSVEIEEKLKTKKGKHDAF